MALKNKQSINRIPDSKSCVADQYVYFSFRYLTSNSNYNFDYFKDNSNEKLLSYDGLLRKLEEMSKKPWLYWLQKRKKVGLETIPYYEIRFKASDEARLNNDTTLYVIRFDTHRGYRKGRIIGFKEDPCAVFNIIGFDFEFSAYGH